MLSVSLYSRMHISQTSELLGSASCSLLLPCFHCARSFSQHLMSWNIVSFRCHASVIYCVWVSPWSKKHILHFHTWHMKSHKSKSLKSDSRASWLRVKLQIWFTQFELGEARDAEDNIIGKLTFLPLSSAQIPVEQIWRCGKSELDCGLGRSQWCEWLLHEGLFLGIC